MTSQSGGGTSLPGVTPDDANLPGIIVEGHVLVQGASGNSFLPVGRLALEREDDIGPAIRVHLANGASGGEVTFYDFSGNVVWEIDADGSELLAAGIGVFGATPPAVKPVVDGSRGGNAALTSLLTALASYGLITDSTTV